MIALLIGGTVVLCVGVLTVVFGIPIKEFSFGNTMILAGAVMACTGLVLMGLYFVSRELRNLTRRLEAGLPVSAVGSFASRDVAPAGRGRTAAPSQPKNIRGSQGREEGLFPRDPQAADLDSFDDLADHSPSALPSANAPSLSAPWQDEPPVRTRSASPPEPVDRHRRDVPFTSRRRDVTEEIGDFPGSPDSPSPLRNGRSGPRRGDAASVSIVKSGVVDSMAYSLYSDGSIEAQMPEGMVRFSSIEELRSHLDQRH
ncbi:MAG: hypothetical protein HY242_00390 [Afipia sp.]|nr:hypothetical protein [Afipia sp.]